MACGAVPSVTTRRMANGQKVGLPGRQHFQGGSVRGLLSSPPSRPSGMRPPLAMAAATRAILKGRIRPAPAVGGEWEGRRNSAGFAGRRCPSARGVRERFQTHVVHAQLREIRVARDRDGVSIVSFPWAWSPISSLMGRFHPAIVLPPGHRQGCGTVDAVGQPGVETQGGDGGHQLEGRARGILAVARAVQQFIGRRARRRGFRAAPGRAR